ncbi:MULTISPECIES: putative immunity protein [unclassified Paenibacillus]|uniref:putative immunity protein n=1 Tax=unclassified Paenibacillus TaxID=185978 RepID=UPI0010493DBC|nr:MULTISPECIES: hypothetical protein [unclassified Paenibacillus]NIK71586.1 acyl-coenzyme A synthetase/AMP-(fatty) acid ligase [Paenibacillus sp. BK720]TCM96235.1 hypothetical protein EV294_105100 [Paenibacillus sp. BK033]
MKGLIDPDRRIADLVKQVDHRVLALWAADCADRARPCFEVVLSEDNRMREAILAARAWSRGELPMSSARKAATAAHTAARDVIAASSAASRAARAAGHAAATAHVASHAVHAASYAATAIRDLADKAQAKLIADQEREWQYMRLIELLEQLR